MLREKLIRLWLHQNIIRNGKSIKSCIPLVINCTFENAKNIQQKKSLAILCNNSRTFTTKHRKKINGQTLTKIPNEEFATSTHTYLYLYVLDVKIEGYFWDGWVEESSRTSWKLDLHKKSAWHFLRCVVQLLCNDALGNWTH